MPVLFHLFALSVLLGSLAYASGSLIPGIIGHTAMEIFNLARPEMLRGCVREPEDVLKRHK